MHETKKSHGNFSRLSHRPKQESESVDHPRSKSVTVALWKPSSMSRRKWFFSSFHSSSHEFKPHWRMFDLSHLGIWPNFAIYAKRGIRITPCLRLSVAPSRRQKQFIGVEQLGRNRGVEESSSPFQRLKRGHYNFRLESNPHSHPTWERPLVEGGRERCWDIRTRTKSE